MNPDSLQPNRLQPRVCAALDRQTEYNRIIESFDVLSIPPAMQAEIREALDSPVWDWFTQCDGCT